MAEDEMVVFSHAVHPEHQSRPAQGWFSKGQKTSTKATSGRKRLNIQGALDLEIFQFIFVEGEKINAQTTRQMLEKLERNNLSMTSIHVLVDNARYHHAKILEPWLDSPKRRVKLYFLPADLRPDSPSFITRICEFEFHIRRFRFGQAHRARSPQIAQALNALQRVLAYPEMSTV